MRLIQAAAFHVCVWLIDRLVDLADRLNPGDMEDFPEIDTQMSTIFEHDPNEEPHGESISTFEPDLSIAPFLFLPITRAQWEWLVKDGEWRIANEGKVS